MAQYTKSQLVSASNATYFTNTSGGISASAVRDLNDSWISSSALLSGSNTFIGNQIISGTLTAQLPANYIWLGDSNGYNQAVATSSISLQGAQGIQGIQGTQGTQGIQGIQGLQGLQGLQGIQGLQGTQGIQGITGLQGIQGIEGASGSQGIQGLQGTQGLQGIQGADNSTQGTQGLQGIQGLQGLQGIQGISGSNGATGSQGIQGLQGLQGIQGADNSTQGIQGTQGLQGIQGITGISGSNGAQGIQGIQGIQGTDNSTQGTQGIQGITGLQGITGISGSNGAQGTQGIQGVQGTDNSTQGAQGAQGIAGSAGSGSADTGSLLVTASFASTNITFTKGDATTFDLPGFATTGSNTFTGNQYIYSTSGATPLVISSSAYYGIELVNQGLKISGNGGPRLAFPNDMWFNGNVADDMQLTGDTDNPNTKGIDFFLYGTGSRQIRFRNNSGPGASMEFSSHSGSIQFTANNNNMSLNAGGTISITGSQVNIQNLRYPATDGTNGQAIITNGSGILSFGTVSTGSAINTGSLLVTGSVAGNVLTFTKADATTFSLTVDTGSGGTIATGSLLVTASFDTTTRDITFTKGDATTFKLGGFATTGSNTFTDNQIISRSAAIASLTLQGSEASLDLTGSNSYIKQTGVLWFRNQSGATGFRETNFVTRNNVINFGADNGFYFARTDGVDGVNSSGGVEMNTISGSLVLAPSSFSLTTGSLSHISASSNTTLVNLIFKNNSTAADTIISGSNNIFVNPAAPTAGFKRYVGGSGNIALNASNVPQRSGSMAFSPTMNNNYFGGNSVAFNMRGPVSSSAWTISGNSFLGTVSIGSSAANNAEKLVSGLNMTANNIAGTLNIIANKSLHTQQSNVNTNIINGLTLTLASSSIVYTNNIGGCTITNSASGSALSVVSSSNGIYVIQNIFLGNGITITTTGSSDPGDTEGLSYLRHVEQNQIFGAVNGVNLPYAETGSNSLNGTMIAGYGLGVTGSNASSLSGLTPNAGSAFFGRYNAQDGNRAQSAQTVFAVGTGNSTTRKTGFLIDSGSNSYFEGTLNVSGSSTFNGNQTITGSLTISGSAAVDLSITGTAVITTEDKLARLTMSPASFNVNSTKTEATPAEGYIFGPTGSDAQFYLGVYDDPNFTTDVELNIKVDSSNGISFKDWDNVTAGDYIPFMNIAPNLGDNPSPQFTRGLGITGSLVVSGNQTLQSFTTLASVSSSLNFADDTAAAAGGVPLGGLYRNGNFVMIRLT